jgi:UDP-N-acetylglucosamine 2-epimerase (non-hydrolysing)
MKVVSIVGARPQFVKLAPVAEAMTKAGVDHVIVHTGQHYDQNMSGAFFADLAIPAPTVNLHIGSASHGAQTGQMLAAIEEVLEDQQPDWVLVYGDTNSTLAGALAAVKIHQRVAHLEAGLRSFNRRMPEEINRVLTDHAADLLLPPTDVAMEHLRAEGLADHAVVVGDVMTDVCYRVRDAVVAHPADYPAPVDGEYLVATIHRADNTDDADRLGLIVDQLAALPVPVVLLAHPRLRDHAASFGIDLDRGNIVLREPLPYPLMVAAVLGSRGVVTDSGGLQKEAYLLDRICTTLRTETEWVETLEDGWNVLVPTAQNLAEIALRPRPSAPRSHPYGDGHAADAVVRELVSHLA